ncbi:lipase chaperone [Vibrio fluvialis]|uniref:lipase secretion chaperone n=1 Tax=Vibrio fluvialis TaxID=676 RepID=UPI00192B823D|nr:lipase secretion chaperone [Vibrio fluvialis]MBL4246379.1 lipase chaperone [Vibrio fluvialis]MBL4254673.1 lipase chaperone [Vibrio fluvialis]MBY7999702.1 lipase chaperone [Vibrio fluvialis]
MQKTALCLGIVAVLGSLSAAFWPSDSTLPPAAMQVASQSDTELDQSSPRDLLDYFVSGLGEGDLKEIEHHVANYEQSANGFLVDGALFDQFVLYKQALAGLEPSVAISSLDYPSLAELNQQILTLQLQFFTPQQQQSLFGEENQLRHLATEKLRIAGQASDAADAKSQWQSVVAEQEDYIQRSEQNADLVNRLYNADGDDEQSRYLARVEMVGEAGAQRLGELDNQRAQFQQTLTSYLAQRAQLLADNSLSETQKAQQITALRESSFDAKQWRRVEALERMQTQ